MEHNKYSLRRRPTPDLPRLTRRQQRLYERFDTLSDACWNLSQLLRLTRTPLGSVTQLF